MTDAPADNGLRAILPALVAASALGYGVQLVVPIFTAPAAYVVFTSFWSALFLCVAAFSGVQQEVARSSSPGETVSDSPRVLRRFAVVVAAAGVVVGAVVGVTLSFALAPEIATAFVVGLVVGVTGYGLLALGAGVLYGTSRWRGVAVAAVADPALRALAVGVVIVIGLLAATSANLPALLVACAVPFVVAAAIVWRAARPLVGTLRLDAALGGLVRNSLHTVVAALSLGIVVSGVPLIVGVVGRAEDSAVVAGILFLVVLARAPLVSPLLALQSYLTVRFVKAGQASGRAVLMFAAVVVGAAALLGVVVVLLAPFVFGVVVPSYVAPPTWLVLVIIGSAGLVAVQCVTGPAVLAQARHRAFSAGWLVTALGTLASLVLPVPFAVAVVVALVAGPVLGIAVHAIALAVPSGAARAHR